MRRGYGKLLLVLLGLFTLVSCYGDPWCDDVWDDDCGWFAGKQPAAAPAKVKTDYHTFAGSWNVTVSRLSTTCTGAPNKIIKAVQIAQRKGKIKATITNMGTYAGTLTKTGFKLRTRYTSICPADVSVAFTGVNPHLARVYATAAVTCVSGYKYRATYRGKALRN
jgi:hypothetical protein